MCIDSLCFHSDRYNRIQHLDKHLQLTWEDLGHINSSQKFKSCWFIEAIPTEACSRSGPCNLIPESLTFGECWLWHILESLFAGLASTIEIEWQVHLRCFSSRPSSSASSMASASMYLASSSDPSSFVSSSFTSSAAILLFSFSPN